MMCFYDDDFEQPKFFREASPVARKSHVCDECSRTIQPGSRYSAIVGKWGRLTESIKACPACVEIRSTMAAIGCSYTYGGLIDCAHEALDEHADADPAALDRLAELLGVQREDSAEVA